METQHDPYKQAAYLLQCLAEDKRPIGALIGAGCPTAIKSKDSKGELCPLIPDIKGLTDLVAKELAADKSFIAINGQLLKDNSRAPNIEEILGHIRSLRQVAGLDTVRGLTAQELDDLDQKICISIVGVAKASLPTDSTPYHHLAAWAGARTRQFPFQIFTTNYDLLMEQALEALRVPYFDGFIGSHSTFFDLHAIEEDVLPPRWARLWKLHGSINWSLNASGAVCRAASLITTGKHVIHPSHLKYDESRRMPYLAMIDRFKAFLRQHSAVGFTCGYSFADGHINEIIGQGLQGNPSAVVFALLYGKLDDYPKAKRMASRCSNLILLADNAAVIGSRAGIWPTVGKGDISAHGATSVAVEWDDQADGKNRTAHFTLGDFVKLGTFFEQLLGRTGP